MSERRNELTFIRPSWVAAAATVLLAAFVVLAGCASSAHNTWTVALYLCGSNLESEQGWATKTLRELADATLPDNVSVVVQAGGAKSWKSDIVTASGARLQVKGGEFVEVGQAGDASMGDAQTLTSFLEFVEQNYPADHTAVVLWDHGGGPIKGTCFDETAKLDSLTLAELSESFAAGVSARGGKPYDLVGFDACLMASLETAMALKDHASWLVASEEIETGGGWSYPELLEALGKGSDAKEAGTAICDAYVAKSAKRKKEASSTLATIDLSKADVITEAFLDMIKAMRAECDNVEVMRSLAYGARGAESFGGMSKNEGHTNLVDLSGFVENITSRPTYQHKTEKVLSLIDEVIPYSVCGKTTSAANGLSLWYPSISSVAEVAEYAKTSPLDEYAKTLTELFSEELKPIRFLDSWKVGKDGGVTVTVDPTCAGAFYDLYVTNRRTDGTYADTNVDLYDDWDNLSFTYYPARAVALTLNDMLLDANMVDYGDGYQMFSSPVMVNGRRTNLRTCWYTPEDEDDTGEYQLMGTWDGIDKRNGLTDRSLDELEPGSVVGAISLESADERERTEVSAEPVVGDTLMPAGSYEFWFVGIDLLGNEYPSGHVAYEVTESGGKRIVTIDGKPIDQRDVA